MKPYIGCILGALMLVGCAKAPQNTTQIDVVPVIGTPVVVVPTMRSVLVPSTPTVLTGATAVVVPTQGGIQLPGLSYEQVHAPVRLDPRTTPLYTAP